MEKKNEPSITHAVFGDVNVDPVEGVYWQKKIKLADREVSVDLTIGNATEATPELLETSAKFVTGLAAFDTMARASLRASYDQDSDSAIAGYVTHHLEELTDETVMRVFGKTKDAVDIDAFLGATFLRRVGLYPATSEGYATFDYTIGDDVTQYLLVVRFDDGGQIAGIDMVS